MKKIIGIFIIMLLIGTVFSQVSACTGFTYNDGEDILVGCNFDWSLDYNVFMNVFPAADGKFGRVIFEMYWSYDVPIEFIMPLQGINDQGLFYDTYYTPYLLPVNSSDKPVFSSEDPEFDYYGPVAGGLSYCLAKCTTVTEAIDLILQYNLEDWTTTQLFLVDRFGDSAILEGDDIIYRAGDFQVVSNFYHSHPELGGLGNAYERYAIAVSMLENMTDFSVEYFTSICNATHQRSTDFSNVFDIKQGKIFSYYLNDFENAVEIDIDEELAKGRYRVYLGSLFEPEGNQGPSKTDAPTGNETGSPGEEYRYSVRKVKDPDGDSLSYMWDWGDGTFSNWIPAAATGAYLSAYHLWDIEGTYEVRVKAMDMYGSEGEWSDPLVVSMPKSKAINEFNPWIFRLIQRFPILEFLIYSC